MLSTLTTSLTALRAAAAPRLAFSTQLRYTTTSTEAPRVSVHEGSRTRAAGSLDVRRRRILQRSWQRGWKENDLIMGSFADKYIGSLDDQELSDLETLLEEIDHDIFAWATGKEQAPARAQTQVLQKLQAHVKTLGRTRTGAVAGDFVSQ
eukprot:TRINITY_DN12058_c0_g1_i2.p1 TRINITY_DN12058_c0_g1~~TRINITY_DN12058_c0_g1_i2.p1  ORF type:complete len:150 (-),score=31.43 TRINITY_DN12058_c0_g1_i2:86-535(-)